MMTRPGADRRVPRVAIVLASLFATGCVYFNGIYNAKEAAQMGDRHLRRGDESQASSFFSASATSAESVLVRHPNSKWRQRALYLAGRGAANAGMCERALERLSEYLSMPVKDSGDFNRARVARGMCEVRMGRLSEARIHLDSLINLEDTESARQARIWASRAALGLRDADGAEAYLADMNIGTMAWELLSASIATKEYTRVESLLVQRASVGDYRNDVINGLRELMIAGRFDAAQRIVAGYDEVRARDAYRVSMHYLVGDYLLRAGRDTAAERHLFTARQMAGRDSVVFRESSARLALLGIRRFEELRDIDSTLARLDSAVKVTQYARRVSEQAALVRLLSAREDSTGASVFLAGEVARDSLNATRVARGLFLRVARDIPGSPLAPSGYYAASLLEPDSAEQWKQRILEDFPQSSVAAWIRGEDPALRSDYATNAELLSTTFVSGIREWADSLRRMRAQPQRVGGTSR